MVYGTLIKRLTASELILNQYWTTDKLYCARWVLGYNTKTKTAQNCPQGVSRPWPRPEDRIPGFLANFILIVHIDIHRYSHRAAKKRKFQQKIKKCLRLSHTSLSPIRESKLWVIWRVKVNIRFANLRKNYGRCGDLFRYFRKCCKTYFWCV